jgi:hypothetical protein
VFVVGLFLADHDRHNVLPSTNDMATYSIHDDALSPIVHRHAATRKAHPIEARRNGSSDAIRYGIGMMPN